MSFQPHRQRALDKSLPRSHNSIDEVQRWILSWFVSNMNSLDILDLHIESRIKLLPWDGKAIKKASRTELSLHLKWVYTYDGNALESGSEEEMMLDSLIDNIQRAQAWRRKVRQHQDLGIPWKYLLT